MRDAAGEIEAGRRRGLELERTRAWGEMARRVAHEMKNPLTPLRLAAWRLERGIQGNGAGEESAVPTNGRADLHEAVAVIKEETDRLDQLASSFAQLGRPPAGPATEVDLNELLRNLLDTDVPPGIQKELRADAGTLSVIGHYDGLQRAFRNVIRNAVEAVSDLRGTGERVIQVHIGNAGRDTIEVTIGDNGPGIPEGNEEAIFEPDRTFKAKGTGLGLALVRQVTAWHGGSVTARRRPGGGAEFVIVLPKMLPRALAQTARG
jgi:two-component system nitrogen regulation sensor histidine kinase NtrY